MNPDMSMENLRAVLSGCRKKAFVKDFPKFFRLAVWELMKTQSHFKRYKESMDKKMAKVTKQMKTAERDIKKKKPKAAVKALKGAEKKNVKLTKIDRTVRDPLIKKCKKSMKKGKKK